MRQYGWQHACQHSVAKGHPEQKREECEAARCVRWPVASAGACHWSHWRSWAGGRILGGDAQTVHDLADEARPLVRGGGLDGEGVHRRGAVGLHGVLGDAQPLSAAVVLREAHLDALGAGVLVVALYNRVAVVPETTYAAWKLCGGHGFRRTS